MKKFFLHNGQQQEGPFSVDELHSKKIQPETFVWIEGMSDWKMAKDIEDLDELFIGISPPFKNVKTDTPEYTPSISVNKLSSSNKLGRFVGKNYLWFLVIIIIAGVAIYATKNAEYNNNYTPPIIYPEEPVKTAEQLRQELLEKERQNPVQYLKANITLRYNLLGENVFEGTITNTASAATFKDTYLKISYISKSNTVIRTETFVVYDIFRPQQTVQIKKYKTFEPNETSTCKITVLNATPVD